MDDSPIGPVVRYVWKAKVNVGDRLATPHCGHRGYDGEFYDCEYRTEEEALEDLLYWLPFDVGTPLLCRQETTVLGPAPPTANLEEADEIEVGGARVKVDSDNNIMWCESPLPINEELSRALEDWGLTPIGDWLPYHLKSVGGYINLLKGDGLH